MPGNNYYTKYDWMAEGLGLKYPDSDVYAIIYSYTANNRPCYESIATIARRIGAGRSDSPDAGRSTVKIALKRLMEKGLIVKSEPQMNLKGQTQPFQYRADIERVSEYFKPVS